MGQIHSRGWPDNDALISFGISDSDLAEAENLEIDLDDYYLVRRTGASHSQAIALAATPPKIGNLLSYVVARWARATHAEIVEAAEHGIPWTSYSIARARGATHEETLDAWDIGVSSVEFEALRRAGISREEIRAARGAGVELRHYATARIGGATSEELAEVLRRQIPLTDYTLARHSATHEEVISAAESGVDLFRYASNRHSGLDHVTSITRSLAGPVEIGGGEPAR